MKKLIAIVAIALGVLLGFNTQEVNELKDELAGFSTKSGGGGGGFSTLQTTTVDFDDIVASATFDSNWDIDLFGFDFNVGSESFFVDGTSLPWANVGIGTDTPTAMLDIEPIASMTGLLFRVASGSNERFRIQSDGNVGIGNTAPVNDLDILRTDGTDVTLRIRADNSAGDPSLIVGTDANNWSVGVDNSESDRFVITSTNAVDSNQRLIITTVGNLGIGTTAPASLFDIQPPTNHATSTLQLVRVASSSGTEFFTIIASGSVGIGDSTPERRLDVTSDVEGATLRIQDTDGTCDLDPDSGSLVTTCTSDSKLKNNIVDASSKLAYLDSFRIREYDVKASGNKSIGVIAQEIQVSHPELVSTMTESNEVWGTEMITETYLDENEVEQTREVEVPVVIDITYTDTLAVTLPSTWDLVKAIQELKAEVELLKGEPIAGQPPVMPVEQGWFMKLIALISKLWS